MIIIRPPHTSKMPVSNLPQLIKGYFEGYDHMESYAPNHSREEIIESLAGRNIIKDTEDRRRIQLHDIFEISKRGYKPSKYAGMIIEHGRNNPQGIFDFLDFQVAACKQKYNFRTSKESYGFHLFDMLSGHLFEEKNVEPESLQTRYSDYQSALGFMQSYLSNEDEAPVGSKKLFDPCFIQHFLKFVNIMYETFDSENNEMRINDADIIMEDLALDKLRQLETNFTDPRIKPKELHEILKKSVRE